jgi:phenylpyruvate tautomerase PptA (4-oxalocrotonate tautomerase family)
MPILEVVHAAKEPATTEQKQAFVRSAVEIFRDVLGTPDGRLRVFFYSLDWEDCVAGLLEGDSGTSEDNTGARS